MLHLFVFRNENEDDKLDSKQGRAHDNRCRGRLGRGSNELGRGSKGAWQRQ